MGIFSKIKNKIKKAIPKEIAPFLPALASIYGGPMLANLFGSTGMLGQGIGAFLADAGTQELTSDRTRLESSLFSGIMGAARGIPNANAMTTDVQGPMRKPGFTIDQRTGAKIYSSPVATSYSSALQPGTEAYKTAFGNLGTKEKILQGARDFARAPLDNPISIASASNIGVTASPKLGYNEVERMSRDLASRAAASAKARGLSYEESMKYAKQYFYGSNPGATEAEYNAFMEYYNSDLKERLDAANGGRIGFADGSRDRDSLNMNAFYDAYPETQVGSYINENRYKSEKIEKLETKLNEIIDMRKRTADRSRDSENMGMPSLMEKLLDKEISNLHTERLNDDIRKSEAQIVDERNAFFAEENAKKQQMIQDYYNNLGVYARPGRAMGGIMNPRMGYSVGGYIGKILSDPTIKDKLIGEGILNRDGSKKIDKERIPKLIGEGILPPSFSSGLQNLPGANQGIDLPIIRPPMVGDPGFDPGEIDPRMGPFPTVIVNTPEGPMDYSAAVRAGYDPANNFGMPRGNENFMELEERMRLNRASGGSMNMMDRPNFNYGSGRQTPQGDPIAPNVPPGMQMDLRPGGFIELGTEPRADDVPAMVGKDEFVLNDRAVAGIGKALTGRADPRAGARALYDLQSQMEATV